ncbi:hypothetical protein F511_29572 [Dorcoceras hygrometricum]|uniref:Uncharacterized protein n=1 Tax=Dorcoceras hygrometricum TaxID=472368 RepID=A0A2Z7BY38_9LAMI|nr:hypothetical protein F511_29572 [Dorcoceras hygrometricum]
MVGGSRGVLGLPCGGFAIGDSGFCGVQDGLRRVAVDDCPMVVLAHPDDGGLVGFDYLRLEKDRDWERRWCYGRLRSWEVALLGYWATIGGAARLFGHGWLRHPTVSQSRKPYPAAVRWRTLMPPRRRGRGRGQFQQESEGQNDEDQRSIPSRRRTRQMPPRRRGRGRGQIQQESEGQNDEDQRSIPSRRRTRQVEDEIDELAARVDDMELVMVRFPDESSDV